MGLGHSLATWSPFGPSVRSKMLNLSTCRPNAQRSSSIIRLIPHPWPRISVIKGRPASRGQGPLNEPRFKEIWAIAVSAEIKERPQKDVEEIASNSRPSVVHGLSRVKSPWMPDSLVERRSRRISWNVQPARGSLGRMGWTHGLLIWV
ncbi:hypothetical protein BS47DRAFT_455108 [Hydnum rufescens UP504]|uniref:Uncharacterized protein n=1 Tax=Hydnum rufescens UP504 TaxID=1448309 RepID=A0A9P6AJ01_9AGAM|nr:hypothetical protein BS47DRAFT_455108 [Hydnum rufescens UP504]